MPPFLKKNKVMATKIHQTGTREAWVFKHDDHDDPVVIMPTSNHGKWYVVREHGHQHVNPCAVMDDREIFETYGFLVGGWDKEPPPTT